MTESCSDPVAEHRLQILLSEYEAGRDDDRSTGNSVTALASVAVALLGGIVAVLMQDCRTSPAAECWRISDSVYAILPLPPMVLMAYGLFLSAGNSVRSYYLRLIERELSQTSGDVASIQVPASVHLSSEIARPRGTGRIWQVMLHGSWTAIFVILVGVISVALARIGSAWIQGSAIAIYAVGLLLMLRAAYLGSFGAYSVWERLHEGLGSGFERPLINRETRKRSLRLLNIILPRPSESVKFLFLPAGALLGILVYGSDNFDVYVLLLGILGFEFFLYQVRYLFNDLRGAASDADHPQLLGRPDYTISSNAKAAVANMIVRLVAALSVAGALWYNWGSSLGVALLSAYVAVVAVTSVYEILRSSTAVQRDFLTRPTRLMWLLYVWVGLGYGIRVMLGTVLATGGSLRTSMTLIVLLGTAFGIMFVTMTWTLQSTKFRNPPTELAEYPANIQTKGHFVPLFAVAAQLHLKQRERQGILHPDTGDIFDNGVQGSPDCRENGLGGSRLNSFADVPASLDAFEAPLRRSSSLMHPWNLSAVIALASSAAIGGLIVDGGVLSALAIGGPIGLLLSGLLVWLPRVAGVVASALLLASLASPWVATLERFLATMPGSVVALTYLAFRFNSAAKLEVSPGRFVSAIRTVVDGALTRLAESIQGAELQRAEQEGVD